MLVTGPTTPTTLRICRGPQVGTVFVLDRDIIEIGRHPDTDIFLDDITVTRRHACLNRTPTGYEITDLGSLNGTYVNQERVHRAPVKPGDEIQIGRFRFSINLGERAY